MKTYDLVVIGGGSAGYAAARTAIAQRAKVAVIEGGKDVGGLCILRGCMPTKALLETAHRNHEISRAGEFGLSVPPAKPQWEKIIERKNRLIEEFASFRREQLQKGKFDFIRAKASFLDPYTLQIEPMGKGKPYPIKAKTILIATGSVVARKPIPGLEEVGYWTSDEAIHVARKIGSLIILGGRAVALELAQYFQHLGTKITILQRSARILPQCDQDVSETLTHVFTRDGATLHLGTELVRFEKQGSKKAAIFRKGGKLHTVVADEILYALGRDAATATLNLAAAKIKTLGLRVLASATMQTSQKHIFAAGDVCGPYEVVHLAVLQGEVAARNALRLLRGEKKRERMSYRLKTEITFTEPEIASVGLNEAEAYAKGIDFLVASYPFNDHGKSIVMGAMDGFVKILAEKKRGEIIGAHIVGPHASDLIHEFIVAMNYRSTVHEFLKIPHYHPTLAEIVTYPAEEIAGKLGR